ncbi:hypothetical protein NDU88_002033 [Pleurodeles waltl]|uniref:Uncharacterized protein n=1 Tax=Pleurodeles waltl TaxID=8319 RepID=A0AAV7UUF4_PLEWA|nr:hypothetical protein NDU88_002033 [Pleurodeles waltl]
MWGCGRMTSDAKVQEALRLLLETGRLDMVREEALHAPCPERGGSDHFGLFFVEKVDNLAVVQVINRQSARDTQVLKLLRVVVLQCLRCDILFRARHVTGVNNDIADALSRSQWERFHGLVGG